MELMVAIIVFSCALKFWELRLMDSYNRTRRQLGTKERHFGSVYGRAVINNTAVMQMFSLSIEPIAFELLGGCFVIERWVLFTTLHSCSEADLLEKLPVVLITRETLSGCMNTWMFYSQLNAYQNDSCEGHHSCCFCIVQTQAKDCTYLNMPTS